MVNRQGDVDLREAQVSVSLLTLWLGWLGRDGMLRLVWSWAPRLVLQRGIGERERVCVCVCVCTRARAFLCCVAENWTEEGDLRCGCPHSLIPYKHIWKITCTVVRFSW